MADNSSPAHFDVLAAFICGRNQYYRVFVRENDLTFIWAGKGSEGTAGARAVQGMGTGVAGHTSGFLVGRAMEYFVDHSAQAAVRSQELEQKTLAQLLEDNKRNFHIHASDVRKARLIARSNGYAQGFSDHRHQARLYLWHTKLGKFRLGLQSIADVQVVMDVLPAMLPSACQFEIPRPDKAQQCSCRYCAQGYIRSRP